LTSLVPRWNIYSLLIIAFRYSLSKETSLT